MNNEHRIVSVIVPTYNRGVEVTRIVNLLLNQDYKELEVIVINDGSSDNTAVLLDGIKDNRLRVVNKENGGPSAARNKGIDIAKGEYLMFVDDDDDIPLDYISSFMKREYECYDLIIDSYSNQIDDGAPTSVKFPMRSFGSSKETIDFLCGNMPDRPYCFFNVGKRFRTSIIKSNKIRFNPILTLGEDRPFIIEYLLFCRKCCIINNGKYIVRSQTKSAYRLSKGLKELGQLWQNIHNGYDFLNRISNTIKVASVKKYADNYLATRSIEYIFYPYCLGLYRSIEEKLVVKDVINLLMEIDIVNVSRRDVRLYLRLLRQSTLVCKIIVITRLRLSKLKNTLTRR